eukprot:4922587-Pyramimonas_sp.AAC.1
MLVDGKIFLKFSVVEASAEDQDLAVFWGVQLDTFYHVSHHSLSPYYPMLQQMTFPSPEEAARACPAGGELVLKAVGRNHIN